MFFVDSVNHISALQIIFLFFFQENNLRKALIPFIGVSLAISMMIFYAIKINKKRIRNQWFVRV